MKIAKNLSASLHIDNVLTKSMYKNEVSTRPGPSVALQANPVFRREPYSVRSSNIV